MSGVGSTNAMKKGSANNPILANSEADMQGYLKSAYIGCIVKYAGPSTKTAVPIGKGLNLGDAQNLVVDLTKSFTDNQGLSKSRKWYITIESETGNKCIMDITINKQTGVIGTPTLISDTIKALIYSIYTPYSSLTGRNINELDVKFLSVTGTDVDRDVVTNWPITSGWQKDCFNDSGKITLWGYGEKVTAIQNQNDMDYWSAYPILYTEPYVANVLYKVVYSNGQYYFEEFYHISENVTTATVEDVAPGKTFYDFTGTKQTGTGTKINPYLATDLDTFKSFPIGSFIKWLGPDRTVIDETTGQMLIQNEIYRAVEDGDVFQYVILPTLENEGKASDLAQGKQLINSKGEVINGTGEIIGDAETSDLYGFVNADDATAESKDIMIGKSAYGASGKMIGSYAWSPADSDEEASIDFYDQYGRKIVSYPLTSLPLSALPEIPTIQGAGAENYTFTWTKTLEEVNALTTAATVGVTVQVAENSPTYLIPNWEGYQGGYNTIRLFGGNTDSSIEIDWGDGTKTSVSLSANSSKSPYHTFSAASHNPIKITKLSGGDFILGSGPSTTGSSNTFLQVDTSNYNWNTIGDITQEIRLGSGIKGFSPYTLWRCMAEKILIPEGISDVVYSGSNPASYYVFNNCDCLESLNIPSTLKNPALTLIDSCDSFVSIYVHEGVETVYSICSSTPMLTSMSLPSTLRGFKGYSLFSGKNIKKYPPINALPVSEGGQATFSFSGYPQIKEITIPSGKTKVGDYFGLDSYALRKIIFPEVITEIGEYFLYYGTNSIKSVEFPEGVTKIGKEFGEYNNTLESVTIPASVTEIGSSMFYSGGYSLKQIIMKGSTPPTLSGEIYNRFTHYKIYVPAGSIAAYASATNWAALASRMEEY